MKKIESQRQITPRKLLSRSGSYLLLVVVALISLAPILWMISASFKSINEILRYPPTVFPENFVTENYSQALQLQPFVQQFLNSVVIMVFVALLTIVMSVPAGYALARVKPIASGIIFLVLLSAMFIPPEATIIPLFQLASMLGWVDTHYPLVIFTAILVTAPIATFVMRQAFLTLPAEYEEAATIDGSGRFRVMLQIYFPLVRPSLASVVVLACWYSWNQFLEPLIYLRSPEMLTVPVALTRFEDAFAGPMWGVQMAATTLSVIPVLLVFFFAQRHVVAGLTAGGLKS